MICRYVLLPYTPSFPVVFVAFLCSFLLLLVFPFVILLYYYFLWYTWVPLFLLTYYMVLISGYYGVQVYRSITISASFKMIIIQGWLFFPSYLFIWLSFFQVLLYRSSASLQLVFHENCFTNNNIFDVFMGRVEFHILPLCSLDPPLSPHF